MNKPSEQAIVESAVRTLTELGLRATTRSSSRTRDDCDAVVLIHHGAKELRYCAEIKTRLTIPLIGAVALLFSRHSDDRLLITDYVTPPMADALKQRAVQFVDSAGNAFLNRRGIFVFVTGRRRRLSDVPSRLRVFRRSGLKILFALLSAPNLVTAPQRSIANAAGVSLGSVPRVLQGLRELGALVEVRGTARLVNRDRLIDQWTEGYARLLKPVLSLARFTAATSNWWRHADPLKYSAQWGGETAAALLQGHLLPEEVIVYADKVPPKMLSDFRLKADPRGRIVVCRRFWSQLPSPRPEVVPALLIYADLVTTGDARSIEAAKKIQDAYIG